MIMISSACENMHIDEENSLLLIVLNLINIRSCMCPFKESTRNGKTITIENYLFKCFQECSQGWIQ